MNRALKTYNIPRLNYEETESLKRPITSMEIKSVIKNIPTKKNAGSDGLFTGVSNLWESLSHTGRRRVVLGHIFNTLQHVITKESHSILCKFTTLCLAAFVAILGCIQSTGCRLHTPGRILPNF